MYTSIWYKGTLVWMTVRRRTRLFYSIYTFCIIFIFLSLYDSSESAGRPAPKRARECDYIVYTVHTPIYDTSLASYIIQYIHQVNRPYIQLYKLPGVRGHMTLANASLKMASRYCLVIAF